MRFAAAHAFAEVYLRNSNCVVADSVNVLRTIKIRFYFNLPGMYLRYCYTIKLAVKLNIMK